MEGILTSQLKSADTFGYLAALLTTIAFLPQVIRTFKTKTAEDISTLTLVFFIIGLLFWIIYGWLTKAPPILIANVITLILNCSILILKLLYQNKQGII